MAETLPRLSSRALSGDAAGRIVSGLKRLGYRYVTLDLEGYRTGSMNETLKKG